MLGWALSLGSTAMLFPGWHQPAVAVDLKIQNNNLNNLRNQPVLNVIQKFKTRLFPHLTTEKQSTFAQLPLLTPSAKVVNSSDNRVFVNFALNSDSQTNLIPQLPPLTLAEASINSQPSWQIYAVKPGDTLNKIARQYGTSTSGLLAIDDIDNPNFISIGGELNIPQIELAQAIATETVLTSALSISEKTLEPLKKSDVSEQTPNLFGQNLTVISDSDFQSKAPSTDLSNNPYIAKLRADIKKLRALYQKPITSDYPHSRTRAIGTDRPNREDISTFESPTKVETTSLEASANLKGNILVKKDFLSVAPIDISSYLPVLATNTETTATIIQPELPPLSSPEEYLPTVFNGYNWPAKGTLTSGYGWRWGRLHKGIDIAGPIGTPILAAAPGEVIFAGWNSGGYGKLIKIEHPDSSVTLYAHNNKIMVTKGQKIRQGQQIAEMGSTGFSTGPHLHFEIRANGNSAVNPMAFLSKK